MQTIKNGNIVLNINSKSKTIEIMGDGKKVNFSGLNNFNSFMANAGFHWKTDSMLVSDALLLEAKNYIH